MPLLRQGARHACRMSTARTRINWHVQSRRLLTQSRQYSQSRHELKSLLHISPEIRDAVATNKPVVALESTIYTHGALGRDLPQVLNQVVRQNGAVPATIGVLDGIPTVGLTPEEIGRMVDEGARKISRRDFAYVVGSVSTWGLPPCFHLICTQLNVRLRASMAAKSMEVRRLPEQ